MAKKLSYTVNRSMHGDGKDYARGDMRELTETDAAALVATGALSLAGEDPVEREPAVKHTFGQEPSAVNDRGYTTATGKGFSVGRTKAVAKPTDERELDQAQTPPSALPNAGAGAENEVSAVHAAEAEPKAAETAAKAD